MQCRWGTILMQAFFMLPVKKGNADCVLGALLFSPVVIPSSSVTLNATHISLRLPILCLQLKVAFRLVFQTAFLIALHRSPIDRLSINSWFISGMINSSWFPRTLLVLTLKVLHFRKPLSPRQNEDAWSSCLWNVSCPLWISLQNHSPSCSWVILACHVSKPCVIHLYSLLSLPSKARNSVHFSPSLLILT